MLEQYDCSSIDDENCPNQAYDQFIGIYKQVFDTAFPVRVFEPNKNYVKREPWMTAGLLTSLHTKQTLLNLKLQTPTEENISRYKTYLNLYTMLKRNMKVQYYHAEIEKNKFDIKKTWKTLKNVIGKQNDKSNFPHSFRVGDATLTDPFAISSEFNKYFCTIGEKTSKNVSPSTKNYSDYLIT